MINNKSLPLITILIAIVSIHFWSSEPNASQANAVPLQQNSPSIRFIQASTSVIEPDGENIMLTLNVAISKAPEQGEEAKVTYASNDGSAIAGEDYLPVAGELIFPVGSTDTQSFDVVIIGNDIAQPDRNFVVSLTNPVNAIVVPPYVIAITIVDNDPALQFLPIIRGLVARPTPTPTPTPNPYP